MVKTFTLHSISHQQKTPEEGMIYWDVTDDQKRTRKIGGVTTLSNQGFIKNVTAQNQRELPLVEILSLYGEGDTFNIDFSLFNQTFGYTPREVLPETQAAPPPTNRLRDSLRALFQIPFR
jgi:hypothetical protein